MHRSDYAASVLAGPVTDADNIDLSEVYRLYRQAFGPVSWLENPRQGQKLAATLHYAARYNARDRYALVLQVLHQALAKNAEYVLAKISPEAKSVVARARRVCMELHRAYGFIRFNPDYNGTMIGRTKLEHDTADIVLAYFARKYRKQKIVLINHHQAYIWDAGNVSVTNAEDYTAMGNDDFSSFWDAYYDSQVIEGRLNKNLARKHLPKKYWSWVEEGRKLE